MEEGSPWFWKLFGGTIISIIGILLAVILQNVNYNVNLIRNELSQAKSELEGQVARIKDEVALIKAQQAALEEFRSSTKEKLGSVDALIKERAAYSETNVAEMRSHDKEHDAQLRTLSERILRLEEKMIKSEPHVEKK
ncbi:hypothetical protein LBMAG51_10920 [Phycisphaerae bacterium]|nr:hypothetical protein LBMAG51_10920 [Phycisphaerae bacterium]